MAHDRVRSQGSDRAQNSEMVIARRLGSDRRAGVLRRNGRSVDGEREHRRFLPPERGHRSVVVRDVQQGADAADARAELGVSCSRDLPYAIAFDYGQHAQGAQRHLSSGNSQVEYQLYSDAAHQHPIGPRGSGSELRGTGNGDQQRLPVYARLDVSRDAPAGMYTDVVRMTVVW